MNARIGLKVLKPVWLPVQVAVITLCLRWAVQAPTPTGWEPTADTREPAVQAAVIPLHSTLAADQTITMDRPLSVTARVPRRSTDDNEGAGPQASPSTRKIRLLVTAYCPCSKCCGRWAGHGKTASGKSIHTNGGKFVAADTRLLPFYTKLRIPGYAGGEAVPVLDRGGKIKGRRLDVYFPSHAQAKRWGKRWLTCEIQP
jgi:3D (Asp-Asp-Asp) domain-containing protein